MLEFKVDMVDDVEQMLNKLEQKVQTEVLFSTAAAMAKVFYEAILSQTARHIKTGLLHSSIYRAYSPENSTPYKIVYHISVNKRKARHWSFLEYGTSRQRAYPYIRPAFARANDAIEAGMTRLREKLAETST